VGTPLKFSGFGPTITASPLLGEHTDEVHHRAASAKQATNAVRRVQLNPGGPTSFVQHAPSKATAVDAA
jgi:hypothetical protein